MANDILYKGEVHRALAAKGMQYERTGSGEKLKAAQAEVKKLYTELNARYCAMYSAEDRAWFAAWRPSHVRELAVDADPGTTVNS